jgi:hypothetical protein
LHPVASTVLPWLPPTPRPFDLAAGLIEPLGLVLAELAAQPEDRVVIQALGDEAQRRIEALIGDGLDWGVVHGDVTLDNDLAALPWFTIVGNIYNLKFHLVDKPMFTGTESLTEGWAERILIDMRAAAKELLG